MGLAQRPSWLQPDNIWLPEAQKNAPNFTLPDGKIHTAVRKRTDITLASIVGKAGVQAVMSTDAPDAIRMEWLHSKVWNNSGKQPASGAHPLDSLTQADVEYVASTIPLCFAEVNEFYEGSPWGDSDHTRQQFRWYYEKRRQLYQDANKPYRQFCTYGGWDNYNGDPWHFQTGDGSNKAPNDPFFKNKIASVANARATCDYFSLREPEGGGAIIKHYADQPDYASRYYNKAFAAEVMAKGMGISPGMNPPKLAFVDWGHIESLGGNLHNGHHVDRQVGNLGTLRVFDKHPQTDYDWRVGNIFGIGFCRTSGFIPFDERTAYGVDPLKVRMEDNAYWNPFVAGTPPPSTADGYPTEPLRWHDAGFEAAYYYSLCSRTAGEPWQYGRYKVAGQDWIEPKTDGTSILEHASANDGAYSQTGRRGRADCMFRVKGSALDVWAFDPSRGKTSRETLILNPVPGKELSVNLQGSKLALYNETI